MSRYSMKELIKQKYGENESKKKTVKQARSEKRVKKKGKYKVVYDADGVKHMILKDYNQ